MCEFSGKLVAWLDGELPADESAAVERHAETCAECRRRLDEYERVSAAVEAYCDAMMESSARPRVPRSVSVVSAVAGVAAVLAMFFAWTRTGPKSPAVRAPQQTVAARQADPGIVTSPPVTQVHRIQKTQRKAAGRSLAQARVTELPAAPQQQAYLPPDEPTIQIAIPAEEMFPPGAVPAGVNFAADLTIAPDGSAERLRLRPRLTGFERRTTEP